MDEPVPSRLRPARRHGLTSPDPVTAPHGPRGRRQYLSPAEEPDKPPNRSAAGKPRAEIPSGSSPAEAGKARQRQNLRGGSRLSDEILYRGVLGRQEIPSGGCGDADVSLEDRPGLLGGDLPDGVFAGVLSAGQAHLPRRASVVHPGHRPVGGDQPASPVVLDWDHGVGARPAGLAAPGGQQVRPGHQARPDERAHDRVLDVAAAAGTVLPRWPGTHAAPLLPARPAVSGFLARFCGGHGLPHRLAASDWASHQLVTGAVTGQGSRSGQRRGRCCRRAEAAGRTLLRHRLAGCCRACEAGAAGDGKCVR